MERLLEDWEHSYRATPLEYPISDNNRPATYDQFMTLRDTMVFSNKYYADKAGRSLIIGTKLDWTPTDTIEIREPNMFYQTFEPWGTTDDNGSVWKYVKTKTWGSNAKSCEVIKTGRYRIQHKEQFNNISSTTTRIHSYVVQHKTDWTTQTRAVFDWERTDAWLFNRITTYWYVECDLSKWDWLELKMEDQNGNHIDSSTWRLGQFANWRMVEYIDLAYNK